VVGKQGQNHGELGVHPSLFKPSGWAISKPTHQHATTMPGV